MNRRQWFQLVLAASGGTMVLNNAVSTNAINSKPFFDDIISAKDFGVDFQWGVSTAAYQTEGAASVDGKGESIWDRFTHANGNIKNNANADIATNFYYRYREDIELIKYLGFTNFRFSLAWSRILPDGKGAVNRKGIDYYHRVIDACLECGITPWITLYHWDLPQKLEEEGGWTNRNIIDYFTKYVEICVRAFGDKIKNWIVLNEPLVFTAFGYLTGMHAPGKNGLRHFFPAVHHATMCQAHGGQVIRSLVKDANIGTTFSCSVVDPVEPTPKHTEAAERVNAIINRLFIEPAIGRGYPTDAFSTLRILERYMKGDDENAMKFDFDFIGIQNYFRIVVKHSLFPPVLFAQEVKAKDRNVPLNAMNLEIYPKGIYRILKQFSEYKEIKKIIITENGVCVEDEKRKDKRIIDMKRIEFFRNYLQNVLKAKQEGVPIEGYFVWSLTDNFEWSEGFHPRFGLIYIDYQTQQRVIKDSGYWFKNFLH